MAKIRGSKNGHLKFYQEQLEEGLKKPELLVAYVKGVINHIKNEIKETSYEKSRNNT